MTWISWALCTIFDFDRYGFRRARWRDTLQNDTDRKHCEKVKYSSFFACTSASEPPEITQPSHSRDLAGPTSGRLRQREDRKGQEGKSSFPLFMFHQSLSAFCSMPFLTCGLAENSRAWMHMGRYPKTITSSRTWTTPQVCLLPFHQCFLSSCLSSRIAWSHPPPLKYMLCAGILHKYPCFHVQERRTVSSRRPVV